MMRSSDSSSKKKQKINGGDVNVEPLVLDVTAAAGKGSKISATLAPTPTPVGTSSITTDVGSSCNSIGSISNSNSNNVSNSSKKRRRKNGDGEIADSTAKTSVTVSGLKRWKIKPTAAEIGILVPKPTMKINSTNGLAITEYIVGKGEMPREGAKIKLVYEGYFPDGTLFDSKLKHSEALVFRRGIGQVIKGLDLGVDGMRVGGSREITIPPALGYGSEVCGSIPANQTLVFRVSLIGIDKSRL